jgi:hypothetical protein
MNLALVYLSYIPFGTEYLISFLNSYTNKKAGVEHKLVILFNGHQTEDEIKPFLEILNNSGVPFGYKVSPEKFDIGSYFYAAANLSTEYIAFVNTYSLILHDNWLLYLYQNLTKTGVGCVSATGSWSDYPHNDEYRSIIKDFLRLNFSLNKLKKAIFFRFNFFPVVKPHLRTNAFMIKRTIFLNLKFGLVKPRILNTFTNYSGTKLKSLCFEHGNTGMTNQIIQLGLRPLLVNKHGAGYEIKEWREARTFWTNDQENLLVKDNQTMKYELADKQRKNELIYAAWGDK